MSLISWNDSFSVKIKSIDDQHKILFDIVNDTYTMITNEENNSPTEIVKIIDRLKVYALMHFGAEEHFFNTFGLPVSEDHEKAHAAFESKISQLQEDLLAGDTEVPINIIRYVSNWLVSHIKTVDKKHCEYLVERGVN